MQNKPVRSRGTWKVPAAKYRPSKYPGCQRFDIRNNCTNCQSCKMHLSDPWLKWPDKSDMKRSKRH